MGGRRAGSAAGLPEPPGLLSVHPLRWAPQILRCFQISPCGSLLISASGYFYSSNFLGSFYFLSSMYLLGDGDSLLCLLRGHFIRCQDGSPLCVGVGWSMSISPPWFERMPGCFLLICLDESLTS